MSSLHFLHLHYMYKFIHSIFHVSSLVCFQCTHIMSETCSQQTVHQEMVFISWWVNTKESRRYMSKELADTIHYGVQLMKLMSDSISWSVDSNICFLSCNMLKLRTFLIHWSSHKQGCNNKLVSKNTMGGKPTVLCLSMVLCRFMFMHLLYQKKLLFSFIYG